MFGNKAVQPVIVTPVTDDWHAHLVGVEYYPLSSIKRESLDVIFEHQHDAGHHDHQHTWSTSYEKKYMRRPRVVEVVQKAG